MKQLLWLAPVALVLAGCETYDPYYGSGGYPPQGPYGQPPAPYPPQPYPPQPYPPQSYSPPSYPGTAATYRAIGTEPFWDVEIGDEIVFTDRGTGVTVSQPAPRAIIGTAGEIYRTQRIEVNINHIRCSDGMSDRTYPDTVQVYVDGKMYKGCGAPTAFFSSIDERGRPVPQQPGTGAPPLDKTRWLVISINGRPVPANNADYSMQFENGRMAAKFGCNTMSAGYTQTGATIDAGVVMATRMACPDMTFEAQGSAILDTIMTVRMIDPGRIRLDSSAGSIELRRRY